MLRTDVVYVKQDGTFTQAGVQAIQRELLALGVSGLATKLTAAAAVPNAVGGATVDTQARAQLAAIKVAIT